MSAVRKGYAIYLGGSLISSLILCWFIGKAGSLGAQIGLMIPVGILALSCWMYCAAMCRVLEKHSPNVPSGLEFVCSWAAFRFRFLLFYSVSVCALIVFIFLGAIASNAVRLVADGMTMTYLGLSSLLCGYLYIEYRIFASFCLAEIESVQRAQRIKRIHAFTQSVLDESPSLRTENG